MKKLFALILVLALAAGCAIATAESNVLYLITMDLQDSYWVAMDRGVQDALDEAKANGVSIRYVWAAPAVGKKDKFQIECLDMAHSDSADIVLLACMNPKSEARTIKKYNAEGMKFIYVDTPANSDLALCTVASDHFAEGQMAAEALLAALKAAGVAEGKVGIVGADADSATARAREDGFRTAFDGQGYDVLKTQYAKGDAEKAQSLAESLIDKGAVALFGCDRESTAGVGRAIAAAEGGAPLGVGCEQSYTILNQVRSGSLVGTIGQDPYSMGYYGALNAIDYLTTGNETFEDMNTDITLLTAEVIEAQGLLN